MRLVLFLVSVWHAFSQVFECFENVPVGFSYAFSWFQSASCMCLVGVRRFYSVLSEFIQQVFGRFGQVFSECLVGFRRHSQVFCVFLLCVSSVWLFCLVGFQVFLIGVRMCFVCALQMFSRFGCVIGRFYFAFSMLLVCAMFHRCFVGVRHFSCLFVCFQFVFVRLNWFRACFIGRQCVVCVCFSVCFHLFFGRLRWCLVCFGVFSVGLSCFQWVVDEVCSVCLEDISYAFSGFKVGVQLVLADFSQVLVCFPPVLYVCFFWLVLARFQQVFSCGFRGRWCAFCVFQLVFMGFFVCLQSVFEKAPGMFLVGC